MGFVTRRLPLTALALTVLACGSTPSAPSPSPKPTAAPTVAVTAAPSLTPAPSPTPVPLAAPVIIQVENLWAARPQSGLASADLMYEYVTEGGITRFSLIFFGPPRANIGPVRSARLVTVKIVQLLKGLLLYAGASDHVTGVIQRARLPRFNEDTAHGDLFRIRSRYAPHNLYTNGPDVASLLRQAALPPVGYRLWPRLASVPPGRPTSRFSVPFSYTETPRFTWRPDLGGWVRTEPDTGMFIDANTGKPVVASTVILQQVAVTVSPYVEDVRGARGLDYTITGSGAAQVFTGGQEYNATWTQPATGPPQFATAGSASPIGPGLVWICLVPPGAVAGRA